MLSYHKNPLKSISLEKNFYGYSVFDRYSVLAFAQIMKTYLWSPIIWKGGKREGSNFICAHYCGLDFENPDVSLNSIIKVYCDSWHIIGTTRNHQKQKGLKPPMDRFRVLLRFERPITELDEYIYNMKEIINWCGSDEDAFDGGRHFLPCTEIVSINCDEGMYHEAVKPVPKSATAVEKAKREQRYIADTKAKNERGGFSDFCRRWILNVIPHGKRSDTCWRLGKEFCRAGIEYEDAIRRILASATYAGKVVDLATMKDIREQVKSGYKNVYKELDKLKK